ncbi:hypothetical protein GCK32_007570 [Trichostrongylus colubriformis]|uniref:Uncharacterized protein n=1 Tax=Trichostrongylus colubriformis TaxID=6319 RepID=A0AAN8IRG8_TRICO
MGSPFNPFKNSNDDWSLRYTLMTTNPINGSAIDTSFINGTTQLPFSSTIRQPNAVATSFPDLGQFSNANTPTSVYQSDLSSDLYF